MTRGDRIRSMSDEELAEFLSDFKDCAKDCLVGKGVKDCRGICATSETLRMWLQQPDDAVGFVYEQTEYSTFNYCTFI